MPHGDELKKSGENGTEGNFHLRTAREANKVKRFHGTPRHQEETVGHHSANVAAILLWLKPNISRASIVYALMHDWPELYTGDIPYPAKAKSKHLSAAVDDLEEHFWMNRLGAVPPELTESERMYLKVADMLDLVLSAQDEIHMGNLYMDEMVHAGMNYIARMDLPLWLRDKIAEAIEQ